MIKFIKLIALPAVAAIFITSCIRDEAPNAEADIITCEIEPDSLVISTVIDNNSVLVRVNPDIDINLFSNLAPTFTLTDGATIEPASGSAHDFFNAENHTIYYTVTSEDGQWSKRYPVKIVKSEVPSEYSFNSLELDKNGRYYEFSEKDMTGETVMKWATGNPGYDICGVAANEAVNKYGSAEYKSHVYEFYPTIPVFADGTKDKPDYIHLETRSTGFFGAGVKMPIAAGNLFQGEFDMSMAISNPRGATKFGEPYRYVPGRLSGKYRYKAGAVYTDGNGNPVAGKKDMFSIYALFYESDAKTVYLDGTIHDADFSHPNLVSLAMLDNPRESDEWVSFDIEFKDVANKVIDKQKLSKGLYKVGIVISSSVDGDYFKGAVGSALDVKDLKIENKKLND